MTVPGQGTLVYPRLCLAYFCQFAIWGGWAIALGGYVGGVLNFEGYQIGWLYAAIPLGAIIAPLFIGPIADRYFAAQKVLFVLHFIGGLALLACGLHCVMSPEPSFPLLMALLLLSGICYMPSIGLMNSVVFKHLPSASMGPYVFVFGTIGWIVINLFIAAFLGGSGTPYFFFATGVTGVFLAFYSLTLPDTPPKGAPAPGIKSSCGALCVLVLFKKYPFTIFVICAFLASIPTSNYFFPALDSFLTERGYPAPLALATICQFAEIAFMLALPFAIRVFGLKKVLLIGMAAWSIRYLCFAEPYFALAVFGLILHGFGYSFLFVAAYMYAEKVAPAHLKASAQSMMIFLLLGVGQILGSQGLGIMYDANPPRHTAIAVAGAQLHPLPPGLDATNEFLVPIPAWSEEEDSLLRFLDLSAQVNRLLGNVEEAGDDAAARTVDLRELLGGQPLTPATIRAINVPMVKDNIIVSRTFACCDDEMVAFEPFVTSVTYYRDDLVSFGRAIAGTDDFSLTRDHWLAAQARDWAQIWRVPALFIFVWFVVFFVFGRDPKEGEEPTEGTPTSGTPVEGTSESEPKEESPQS